MQEVNVAFIRSIPLRTGLGTKRAVAKKLGVSESTFNRWCNGENFKMKYAHKICCTFHFAWAWLFKGEGKEPIYEKEPKVLDDWIPSTYEFPMFYHCIMWRISVGDSIIGTGVSMKRIEHFLTLGNEIDPNLTIHEFLALINATHLYISSVIKDPNCKFLVDSECEIAYPFIKDQVETINSLESVRETMKVQIENKRTQIQSLNSKVETYKSIFTSQLSLMGKSKDDPEKQKLVDTLIDLHTDDQAQELKESRRLLSEIKQRIREQAENPAKDKNTCLLELDDLLWRVPLPTDTNEEAN